MSLIPSVGGLFGSLFGGQSLYRSIGGIIAPCTISEHHSDTMTITDHPIEIGANITDHSFMNPQQVDIVIAWGSGIYVPLNELYGQLLALQATRLPFDILTGKRKYTSMLMQSIEETTEADTENILRVTLSCRQVFLVSTSAASLAPAANQANPSATADTVSRGTVQTIKALPVSTGSAVIGSPL